MTRLTAPPGRRTVGTLVLRSIGVTLPSDPLSAVRWRKPSILPARLGVVRFGGMAKRQGISKKLRFSVFARDGFACRYCGVQSDAAMLVVDHVIPVAENGTNDESNLITACEACNQGKGARTIAQAAPTESDRLRLLQESREQQSVADMARAAMLARDEFRQVVVDTWCDIVGREEVDRRTIRVIASYAEQYGLGVVAGWIERACMRIPDGTDADIGRYVSGIRRCSIAEGRI